MCQRITGAPWRVRPRPSSGPLGSSLPSPSKGTQHTARGIEPGWDRAEKPTGVKGKPGRWSSSPANEASRGFPFAGRRHGFGFEAGRNTEIKGTDRADEPAEEDCVIGKSGWRRCFGGPIRVMHNSIGRRRRWDWIVAGQATKSFHYITSANHR
ncbi:hypothetical protein VTK26DRAFT_3132 [Humicola hyalothermophila]